MYTPLYIKTDNSLQTSIITIKDLMKFALDNDIKSLAITDTNMYGVMDFYKSCIKNSIKPIIGLELCVLDTKFILYAKNYCGYKNLLKLCTINSEDKLNLVELEKFSSNLICIIPCENLKIYDDLKKIYEDIFFSYKTQNEKENLKYDNLIYMNETLYLTPKDSNYIKYIDAIRNSKPIDSFSNNYSDNRLLTYKEYIKLYPDSIKSNEIITNKCNVEIKFNQHLMPVYKNSQNVDSYTYLKKICIEGLKYRFGNTVKDVYQKRLKYELDIINSMGFCDYFLIVSDYVRYAKDNNILVGTGRGSAVGSLVSYCLMITDVDPIKYDLLFERFLNPERISMPDIDIDFEHEKREEIIAYCIEKYGSKRVAPIITFGTFGAKQALRDVSKVMNIEAGLVDNLCKVIDSKKTLDENYNDNVKVQKLLERKQDLKACYSISKRFEGLKRHTSIHAAGIVMSNIDLDEVIPLDKSHEFYVSGYDMTYLEDLGLLKMDFLAIKYLTTIHKIIDQVNKNYKLSIEFDKIPLNDKDALNIFYEANTAGIFQFESSGMIQFLKKLKANSLEDLFAAIALFRPGPMKNIPSYINRKNGIEEIDYIDPKLEKILKPTYGIMVYQEQIMQIAQLMADYTLGEADILRKAMSKKQKELLINEKATFTKRAIAKGYSNILVDKVFNLMLKFSEYGFNKSHSIGYSIIAYKMAYLKAHYPKIFITYLLSMEINDLEKTKQYIYEARKNNLEILPPNINLSLKLYNVEDNGIRFPLSKIKNVGPLASDLIIKERLNGEYIDIYDFVKRCYGKSVTSKTIESLIYSGAFSSFKYNKKTLISNLDLIVNYGELIKDLDREYALEPEINIEEEYSKKELINYELDVFGFYLTNNPITDLKLKYSNIVDLRDLSKYFDNNVNIIICIDKVKEINTAKGDMMCFIEGSDELSQIDIVLFPKVYDKYRNILKGDIILLNGKVEKRFDKYQVVANKLKILS